MENEIKKLKYEEQKKLLEKLSSMDPESDEYNTVLHRITTLDSMLSDDEKCDKELTLKREQLVEQKKDRILKYGTEAGLGLLTLAFNWIWMKKGFKFEETGGIGSFTFRNLISNFKPPKRK